MALGSATAPALLAAALVRREVDAVICRGGQPLLAREALERVVSPTLFIAGGEDPDAMHEHAVALQRMSCTRQMVVVPGLTLL